MLPFFHHASPPPVLIPSMHHLDLHFTPHRGGERQENRHRWKHVVRELGKSEVNFLKCTVTPSFYVINKSRTTVRYCEIFFFRRKTARQKLFYKTFQFTGSNNGPPRTGNSHIEFGSMLRIVSLLFITKRLSD